jgi:hypothetical protein
MYSAGCGVSQNDELALLWFHKAANLGDVKSQVGLGLMHGSGRGVPRNDMMAYAWFSIAARSKDSSIMKVRDDAATLLTPAQLVEGERLSKELLSNQSLDVMAVSQAPCGRALDPYFNETVHIAEMAESSRRVDAMAIYSLAKTNEGLTFSYLHGVQAALGKGGSQVDEQLRQLHHPRTLAENAANRLGIITPGLTLLLIVIWIGLKLARPIQGPEKNSSSESHKNGLCANIKTEPSKDPTQTDPAKTDPALTNTPKD